MDQLPNNLPTSERFTAEQVRKFLGLNDDYSNSSSSLSSDCENNNLSDISLDINTNGSQSDEEDITAFTEKGKNDRKQISTKNRRNFQKPSRSTYITSLQLVVPVTHFTKTQYLYNIKHLVLLSH